MTIDLMSVVSALLGMALAAAVATMGVLVPAVAKRFGIANNADLTAKLTAALDAGAGEAYRLALAHEGGLSSVAVHNSVLAAGADYVVQRMPDTMKQLGLTPDNVAAMVTARLGVLLARDPTVSAGRPSTAHPLSPRLAAEDSTADPSTTPKGSI